jgi:hypothetical protein
MREIKFRGKTVGNAGWVYGNLEVTPSGFYWISFYPSFGFVPQKAIYEVIPETVGQLMCKVKRDNDTIDEIFEGDLIVHGQRILCVDSINGNTVLVGKDRKSAILLSFNDGKIKVGNVHDNPELLSQ